MQLLMREKMISQKLGASRDLCFWYGGFYTTLATGLLAG